MIRHRVTPVLRKSIFFWNLTHGGRWLTIGRATKEVHFFKGLVVTGRATLLADGGDTKVAVEELCRSVLERQLKEGIPTPSRRSVLADPQLIETS